MSENNPLVELGASLQQYYSQWNAGLSIGAPGLDTLSEVLNESWMQLTADANPAHPSPEQIALAQMTQGLLPMAPPEQAVDATNEEGKATDLSANPAKESGIETPANDAPQRETSLTNSPAAGLSKQILPEQSGPKSLQTVPGQPFPQRIAPRAAPPGQEPQTSESPAVSPPEQMVGLSSRLPEEEINFPRHPPQYRGNDQDIPPFLEKRATPPAAGSEAPKPFESDDLSVSYSPPASVPNLPKPSGQSEGQKNPPVFAPIGRLNDFAALFSTPEADHSASTSETIPDTSPGPFQMRAKANMQTPIEQIPVTSTESTPAQELSAVSPAARPLDETSESFRSEEDWLELFATRLRKAYRRYYG